MSLIDPFCPFHSGAGGDALQEEEREELMWMPVEELSEQEELISECPHDCVVSCVMQACREVKAAPNHTACIRVVLGCVGGAMQGVQLVSRCIVFCNF